MWGQEFHAGSQSMANPSQRPECGCTAGHDASCTTTLASAMCVGRSVTNRRYYSFYNGLWQRSDGPHSARRGWFVKITRMSGSLRRGPSDTPSPITGVSQVVARLIFHSRDTEAGDYSHPVSRMNEGGNRDGKSRAALIQPDESRTQRVQERRPQRHEQVVDA
jgi:hypothetical protein